MKRGHHFEGGVLSPQQFPEDRQALLPPRVYRPGSSLARGRCPLRIAKCMCASLRPPFTFSHHRQTPQFGPSLCPPQISCRHRLRLFEVLVAVIGTLNVLEETWQKCFMQLALEHMTKSTVGHRPTPSTQAGSLRASKSPSVSQSVAWGFKPCAYGISELSHPPVFCMSLALK